MVNKIDRRVGLWIGMALLALLVGIGAMASATFAATPSGAPVGSGPAPGSGGVKRPLDTPTPTPTCPVFQDYVITQSTGAIIVPGATDVGNHGDDVVTIIALPFPVAFYGQTFSSVTASSNGNLQFSSSSTAYNNACLLTTAFNNAIMPHWDDLHTGGVGEGVFTSVSGSAPSRIFNIEWKAHFFSGPGTLNFEVRLYEGVDQIDIIYGAIPNNGLNATVGVQQGTGTRFTQFSCNTASLSAGLMLSFAPLPCSAPTITPTFTNTPTRTNTPTATPGGPTNTPTPCVDYAITASADVLTPGDTLVPGSQVDDGVVSITLPFPVTFYSQAFSAVNASSNGNLQFSSAATSFTNVCLPTTGVNNLLAPYWDDLILSTNAAHGVYTGLSGAAPNRVFVIEWRGCRYNAGACAAGGDVNFEVKFLESSPTISVIYALTNNGGASATVGAQRDIGSRFAQFECNTGGLVNGMSLDFAPGPCGTPTNTPLPTNTFTPSNTITPSNTRTPSITPGGPTLTPTATATATAPIPACGPGSAYLITSSLGASLTAGVTDTGNHCDDCATAITLPFAFQLYDQAFTAANVTSNGQLDFGLVNTAFTNICLPDASSSYAIYPHWDDLNTNAGLAGCSAFLNGCGVFTSVSGLPGNRVFTIEWHAVYFINTAQAADFEVNLSEAPGPSGQFFDVVYGQVAQSGSSATVGVERNSTSIFSQFECNVVGGLSAGQQLHFAPQDCSVPTFTPTVTNTTTSTPTATATNTPPATCGPGSNYVITQATATIVAGVADTGNHIDDGLTTITLPFAYNLYDQTFTTAQVSSNGQLDFLTGDSTFSNNCLPDATASYAIFPHWDDMRTDVSTGCSSYPSGCGVFTSVSGSAPNRVFNIEWRAAYFSSGNPVNFEVRLYEGQASFEIIYAVAGDNGVSATIGVQRGNGPQLTLFSCNTASLSAGLLLHFAQPPCVTATPTAISTPVSTNTAVPAGILNGHLTWQGVLAANRPLVTGTLSLCVTGAPQSFSFTTDTSGNFTITTGLPDGTYNWSVKGGRHVSASSPTDGTALVISGGAASKEFGLQKGGNTNTDNIINSTDFNTFKNQQGQGGVKSADFDYNLVVNVSDFNIQKGNFGQSGHAITCP